MTLDNLIYQRYKLVHKIIFIVISKLYNYDIIGNRLATSILPEIFQIPAIQGDVKYMEFSAQMRMKAEGFEFFWDLNKKVVET